MTDAVADTHQGASEVWRYVNMVDLQFQKKKNYFFTAGFALCKIYVTIVLLFFQLTTYAI